MRTALAAAWLVAAFAALPATGGTRPPAPSGAAAQAAVRHFVRIGLPLYCGGNRGRYVALTFDDGPGPDTALALRILRRAGARATFFLVGRNLASHARLPRLERALGAVGDHTWSHPFLTRLPRPEMVGEIARAKAAIERDTGALVELFRSPFGFHNGAVDQAVHALGMLEVIWSLSAGDAYPPPGASAPQITTKIARFLRPGAIVLMHENRPATLVALRHGVLPLLRRRELRSVSIPELLVLDPPTLAQLRRGIDGCPSGRAAG